MQEISSTYITGKNYIGAHLSGSGSKTYKTFNPTLNIENSTAFTEASHEEIEKAVTLASQAFKIYQKTSGIKKAAFLHAIADEIMALGDVLIHTYCNETGLPEERAREECNRTVHQLKLFADLVEEGSWLEATIDTGDPDQKPVPKPDIRKFSIPLGPVVVFGASNFPLAFSTAGGDTASALAAGCPVIVKSHPMHSGTGELVASSIIKAVQKTEMPDGVFSNLNSVGIDVGVQLVKHSKIKAVGFTGSIKGGRAIFDHAAQRPEPIPVYAEMGSVNPIILFPDALKKRGLDVAKTYAQSITKSTGQFCTKPGLLVGIKGASLHQFIKTLSDEIIEIEPSCMLHPNIYKNYEKNKTEALQHKDLFIAAEYTKVISENYAKQTVTTIEGKAFLKNKTLHQEIFGPYAIVVVCEDMDELLTIVSNLEGQLTGTVIAEVEEANTNIIVIEALQERVGRIIFNGSPNEVQVSPAMFHGGPYPASSDSKFTSVGIHSIKRWVRPFSYQDWPNELLPSALKNENPLDISRLVDGNQTYEAV